MWFDPHAKLAELERRTPATPATTATNRAETAPRVADVAEVATPRRKITPEDRPPAGNTWLDDWRREADDLHNPDNWK